ncbi:sensor histidine kinase [Crocosphaera chwakensis]|uniref:sensor histidine kinase n=1 Tax=Crocosphaera chwakensis TaxID=2546361 RepID=UPI00030F953D|nr:HAMP domain-containing sensor histidine kinase [Crocosphaera chwakensis]
MNQLTDTRQLSSNTIVIATQLRQNAKAMGQVLETQGLSWIEMDSLETVKTAIRAEVGLLIITEEMLSLDNNFEKLVECLNEQPNWSDIPVIFLLKNCRHFPVCMAMLKSSSHQGSLTLLEMPLKRREFNSTVQTCLKNRQRQFQLRDALLRLHQSNQALENFSHVVAHELRNPLNVVTGSLDLLKLSSLENREQKIVEMGLRTSHKMNKTLNTLLEFSKLESRQNLIFKPTDMNRVLEEAVNGLQNIIDVHQASVNWNNLPVVQGNADLLEELVSNLIKNAVIHNGTAAPMIIVMSELRGDRYYFQIVDNGPGISLEDQSEIFKLFSRVGKRRVEGSGIGLALCQRIVDQHGGHIGVDSELGQGSTFYFDLPTA